MEFLKEHANRNRMIERINAILRRHRLQEVISLGDLTITENSVIDSDRQNPKLSGAIIDSLWPSIRSARVYHFTSRVAAEQILNSGIFRLASIQGRLHEHEIVTFCTSHELDGYLEKDSAGISVYRNLIAPNTFYASFAGTKLTEEQESTLWRRFASIDGVRITLDIRASNHDFRRVRYEPEGGGPIPLLAELRNAIRIEYEREFRFLGVSRLCSFYLPENGYSVENEHRIVYRVWDGGIEQPTTENGVAFIELPLNKMSSIGYQLDVVDVQSGLRPNMPDCFPFTVRGALA